MVVPTRHVFVAAALAACFGFAQAQVPRGFARPGGNGQAARNDEPPAGHVNAKMGMAGLHKLAKDPSALSEMMETLKDPEAMREAQRMMEDPAFQREMEKIAGPMRRAMGQPGGSPQTGEQNMQLGMAALSRSMQDPNMIAEAMRAMQDPQTMAQVKQMMNDPTFAAMMGKQVGSTQDLLNGFTGAQTEALGARMRGLAEMMEN